MVLKQGVEDLNVFTIDGFKYVIFVITFKCFRLSVLDVEKKDIKLELDNHSNLNDCNSRML